MIGYTTGVFDLLHIGHLNLLNAAKSRCDALVVGVNTDECAMEYKGRQPVIPFAQRQALIQGLSCVDVAIRRVERDVMAEWEVLRFDTLFVGSDWQGSTWWEEIEKLLKPVGAHVVYLPYTKGVSTTDIINRIQDMK